MNETARTVAKEILEPKIVWIVSLKVLNGIFGKGSCTGEVADANETRFIQIKSQTKAQCWDTSDIADDKNIKVHLKKRVALLYNSVILLSFQLQTHQKKRKKIITLLTQKLPPHLSSLPVLTSSLHHWMISIMILLLWAIRGFPLPLGIMSLHPPS